MWFFILVSSIFFQRSAETSEILDGYSNRLSAFPGDSIGLYLNASAKSNRFVFRLFNLEGKEVASCILSVFPQRKLNQKAYSNGFNYKLTGNVMVPALKSGVYLWENKIPFIIKSRHSQIVVLYSANTENAYCNAGGKSLYSFNSTDKHASAKVSFLRPIPLSEHSESFLHWIDSKKLEDVGYITDIDMEDYSSIENASLLIIPGHSEYWTMQERINFDRFVNDGNDAMVLSGNTMWWQVRYNKSKDALYCYRKAKNDKVKSPKYKTINWNELSLNYPITKSIGTDFSRGGYGRKTDKGWDGFRIVCKSPLLENTDLKKGDILACLSDEVDGAPLSGFKDGYPELNREALGFLKAEIVGYDLVSRGNTEGVATWIVFKTNHSSGIVINTATTNWCTANGIGMNEDIQQITLNMINKLINKENVFSGEENTTAHNVIH